MVLKWEVTPQEQPTKVVYSTVYALAGKVGFCVPRIIEDSQYRERLQYLLAQDWVISQQVNPVTGLVHITYSKPMVMSDEDVRIHLSSLIEYASQIVLPQVNQEADSVAPIENSKPASELDFCKQCTDETRSLLDPVKPAPMEIDADNGSNGRGSESLHIPECIQDQKMNRKGRKERVRVASPTGEVKRVKESSWVSSDIDDFSATEVKSADHKVSYKIVHTIPGRVRFRIPRIAKDTKYAQRLEKLLKADPVVKSERVNSAAASIVIKYDHLLAPSANGAHTISERLSHLANLIEFAAP